MKNYASTYSLSNFGALGLLLLLFLPYTTAAQFNGGSGRGDIVNTDTVVMYSDAMYVGGAGRGDQFAELNNTIIDANALYVGGSGRGDVVLQSDNLYMDMGTMYNGGIGRGDQVLETPNIMLSENFMYVGGDGRGDQALETPNIMLSENFMYAGGDGRGDNMLELPNIMLSENFMYTGGNGRGDQVLETPNIMLSENFMYTGGDGRGDNMLELPNIMLSENFMYSGGNGRGDHVLETPNIMLSENFMYTGGDGRGDHVLETPNIMLSENFMYVGGDGRGDNMLELPNIMLSENFMYTGGTGRGDFMLENQNIMLGDNFMYAGGIGRGDIVETILAKVVSGRVLWRGGQVSTRETDWNQAANWYPASIPGAGDEVAIENNGNGYELILDKNRWIKSLDFNGAGKDVILGNNNLVITSGEISGSGPGSYLKTNGTGCVRQPIGSGQSRLFPIGNSTYNPITITNNTGTLDSFCARVVDEVYLKGLTGSPAYNIPRVKRSWVIEKSSGNSNAGTGVNFQFNWNTGQDSAVVNMVMYYWDGTNWVKFTNGSSNLLQYNYTAYKGNFGIFALGDDISTLPVTWLYMQCARLSEQSVMLNWATGTEENTSQFVVQRKTGSSQFIDIARVNAAGFSAEPRHYRYVDQAAPTIAAQYRIKQVDNDGAESFSQVCMTTAVGSDQQKLIIMPVPADNELAVLMQGFNDDFNCNLIDASGKIVLRSMSSGGMATLTTRHLAAGIYFLQISGPGLLKYEKVLITHP